MAKYESGIMGHFKGRIGPVTGAKWKGIEYMRSRTNGTRNTPSLRQLEHRARFILVSKFVHGISGLLKKGYPDTPAMTAVNRAFADIYASSVRGAYPNFALDFSKILISKGALHNGSNPTARATGNGMIKFDWNDNSDGSMARPTDNAVLLLHCPGLQQNIYMLKGPQRHEGTGGLDATPFTGRPVNTWIAFADQDRQLVSTSVYTGELVIH